MIKRSCLVIVAVALAFGGCAAHRLDKINKEVASLQRECDPIAEQGGDLTSCRQRYEAQATQALTEARKSGGDPLLQVGFYRAAALAAFNAGPLGSQTVLDSSDEGSQACERLPQKDASAPRDCALIRLALPLAVAADQTRKVTALVAKRDALRQTNRLAQLPADNFTEVVGLYEGLEKQEGKIAAIRANNIDAAAPEQLKPYADDQCKAVYCSAMKAYTLAFDVAGVPDSELDELTAQKTAFRDRIEQRLGVIDCRAPSRIAGLPE